MRIPKLKDKVRSVLRRHPETRNSDVALTIKLWEELYPNKLKYREADQRNYVALEDMFILPREDQVSRARRKIQSPKQVGGEELYPPTSMEVAKARCMNMDKWRKEMLKTNKL
jgi:hypothetical protein